MIDRTPLRIAVVAFELPRLGQKTGGVSHFNHRLCSALAEMGHDVTAFTSQQPIPGTDYRVEVIEEAGAERKGRFYRYYVAPLRSRKIDFSPYDLVLSSGDDWAMRRSGAKWVRIMHGSALREAQHNRRMVRKVNLSFLYLLEVLSSLRSTATLYNSADTGKLYPSRPADKVVHLPVDRRTFYPGPKAEQPTLLFVGGLDSRKRGRWVLKLFTDWIKPRLPDARLWMVSEQGPDVEGVSYFQNLDLDELAGLYRQAHVFTMPSTYEGFGIPYLEAMASGTLVVTTPNPGANEILDYGKFGIVVQDDQLADALTDALTRPEFYKEKAEQALDWADDHSWPAIIRQYLAYV